MRTLCLVLLACALAGAATAADLVTPQTAPTTRSPQGAYAIARLELSDGLADAAAKSPTGGPQRLIVGLRDGKLAYLWLVGPMAGDRRLTVERSTLALTGGALTGTLDLRTAVNRGSPQLGMTLKLDLALVGGKLSGTYELMPAGDKPPYKPAKGSATGTLDTAPAAAGALAAGATWPEFAGPAHDMSAGPQPALVDDLTKARPVWRSETTVPTAYGNAPDSRYFTRALVAGNGGGGSSPVVADGTVFVYYYVPSPQSEPATKGNPFWERSYKDPADFAAKMAALNATERESAQVVNHFRPLADDHVVALDAATGAEKWHTVLPLRSPNLQTHKHRGISGVPLYHDGTLYVPNLMSRLYAIDAKTGKLKWESPAYAPAAKAPAVDPPLTPSPIVAGGTIVLARRSGYGGTLHGLDPATGAERWKATGGYVMRWTGGGKDRLITITRAPSKRLLACVDPADGKVLWKQDTELEAIAPLSAVVAGDTLIASPPPTKSGDLVRYEGWALSETGAKRLWQDKTDFPGDENVSVTIAGGRAYLLGKQMIRILDVASGAVVGERKFEHDGPGSNPWLGVVGDRLILSPEGQHGVARLTLLDRDLKDACPLWLPPHLETTAYNSQPIVYPVVDGRLLIRGGDGIYCYDLRSK